MTVITDQSTYPVPVPQEEVNRSFGEIMSNNGDLEQALIMIEEQQRLLQEKREELQTAQQALQDRKALNAMAHMSTENIQDASMHPKVREVENARINLLEGNSSDLLSWVKKIGGVTVQDRPEVSNNEQYVSDDVERPNDTERLENAEQLKQIDDIRKAGNNIAHFRGCAARSGNPKSYYGAA